MTFNPVNNKFNLHYTFDSSVTEPTRIYINRQLNENEKPRYDQFTVVVTPAELFKASVEDQIVIIEYIGTAKNNIEVIV